ncbi:ChrR family anti-sigma-E factor [Lutimaribacter sp. EGI FJ00015]|uniref:ChrR family anti-sigma-E factor n=1 Tax=Lutimaribacter degradans TaxID=2945989 RepID=A0ACC5ZX70_9RHOB|nr:ChrR family anti-sigma-E factor [Lutimaribacter sp. EGI FJ00013]MCM2562931.1 ChrR family anti-sigma-E factor [Lutimaribacter sp. EGI FJ00013]MCO0614099.1 ChrR family anti-sigma-E factor [Lutimaribacter sp. EGI FJ00015]MCO0636076.1 ChrR family anti-sigma-E factor [Lutimaribacter sp. EGI FJ00014]
MTTEKIKHHLTDELLMAYSAGTLPEAFSLVVATHVSLCDDCRAQLASFDTVGGAVLEECAETAMSAGALEATMARIMQGGPVAKPRKPSGVFPAPLQEYVGGDLGAVKWKPVGMGVRQAILPTSEDASVRLLYIPAGCAVPDHGHRGTELTLVLQGAFLDEDGRFARGDVEVADEELEHTPVADIGEDCICLAATDAPLKFRGLMPRLAQPFLKI